MASANKEDSSVMRTLAAVTVVFLNGTFVAALSAMPLFQWNTLQGSVFSEYFWVYLAVSIPLTLVTLIAWSVWIRRQTTIHRAQRCKAIEDFYVGINEKKDKGFSVAVEETKNVWI